MRRSCQWCEWWTKTAKLRRKTKGLPPTRLRSACVNRDCISEFIATARSVFGSVNSSSALAAIPVDPFGCCHHFSISVERFKAAKSNLVRDESPLHPSQLLRICRMSGLNQSQIAALLGVNRQRLTDWLKGRNKIPAHIGRELEAFGLAKYDRKRGYVLNR